MKSKKAPSDDNALFLGRFERFFPASRLLHSGPGGIFDDVRGGDNVVAEAHFRQSAGAVSIAAVGAEQVRWAAAMADNEEVAAAVLDVRTSGGVIPDAYLTTISMTMQVLKARSPLSGSRAKSAIAAGRDLHPLPTLVVGFLVHTNKDEGSYHLLFDLLQRQLSEGYLPRNSGRSSATTASLSRSGLYFCMEQQEQDPAMLSALKKAAPGAKVLVCRSHLKRDLKSKAKLCGLTGKAWEEVWASVLALLAETTPEAFERSKKRLADTFLLDDARHKFEAVKRRASFGRYLEDRLEETDRMRGGASSSVVGAAGVYSANASRSTNAVIKRDLISSSNGAGALAVVMPTTSSVTRLLKAAGSVMERRHFEVPRALINLGKYMINRDLPNHAEMIPHGAWMLMSEEQRQRRALVLFRGKRDLLIRLKK